MPLILDGRSVATTLRNELRAEIAQLAQSKQITPRLNVIQVEGDPASAWYVRSIGKACAQVGIAFELTQFPADVAPSILIDHLHQLNADPAIHGVLVQAPLPKHFDATAIIAALDPRKDVDGQHPLNLGQLAQGLPALVPNTPAGGMELLRRYDLPVAGKHAVVVGRSNVVGKPMALLLLQEHATVTIAHSRTHDLPAIMRQADLVVAAVGRPGLIDGSMIKPGAIVIDFGINETSDDRIVGDVEYASAAAVASAITPVPGGTGPVTNMMLLRNVVEAARQQIG